MNQDPPEVVDLHPWVWRVFQVAIFLGFSLANIYFEWGIDGLTAGVMGAMGAWYATRIVSYHLERFRRQ